MPSDALAPVAVFAYNRPEILAQTLEHLGRCPEIHDSRVMIFCDAPATEAQVPATEAVRQVAREWLRPLKGEVICRPENMRFRNITEGISQMCEEFGRSVVVEDDIVVAPDFLTYTNRGLERYAADEQVYQINGFIHAVDGLPPQPFFLPNGDCWGWGTWRRAWQHYTWQPKGWEKIKTDQELRRRFNWQGGLPMTKMLEEIMAGRLYTWDVQWFYVIFDRGGLALYPPQSLIWNSGYGSGEHMQNTPARLSYVHGDLTVADFQKPRLPRDLPLPEKIVADDNTAKRIGRQIRRARKGTWFDKVLRSIKKRL